MMFAWGSPFGPKASLGGTTISTLLPVRWPARLRQAAMADRSGRPCGAWLV